MQEFGSTQTLIPYEVPALEAYFLAPSAFGGDPSRRLFFSAAFLPTLESATLKIDQPEMARARPDTGVGPSRPARGPGTEWGGTGG